MCWAFKKEKTDVSSDDSTSVRVLQPKGFYCFKAAEAQVEAAPPSDRSTQKR